jgi:D-Tyr-tRNAtyr deacylase
MRWQKSLNKSITQILTLFIDINNDDKKMIDIIIENIKDFRIFNGDNRT